MTTRPYGLLRCGFPFDKTLGMRRLTNYPIDVALGDDDRLYVLCRADNASLVRRYNYADEDLGQFGSVGKDEGQFMWPVSIITDSDENIYISDEYLNRITVFDKDGQFVKCWGESGSEPGQLDRACGIAFDSEENVYVSDSMNHRVQKFSKDGEFITAFGEFGSGKGQLNMPWGIDVDDEDAVYVADWRNDRVQVFSTDGEFITKFGGSGSGDGEFNRPTDVAVDNDGDIYVADWGNDRVQLFNSETRYVQKFLGDATLSQVARDYMLTNAMPNRLRDMSNIEQQKYLRRPKSVTVSGDGRLYISDNLSYRVQVYRKEVIHLTPEQYGPPMRSPTLNQE
ncbi:MAG: NHL repeat-containing protein [Chloroflexota bacterium]|nr:NHL repeat-containing protein [Chloroflexota bacterium]